MAGKEEYGSYRGQPAPEIVVSVHHVRQLQEEGAGGQQAVGRHGAEDESLCRTGRAHG